MINGFEKTIFCISAFYRLEFGCTIGKNLYTDIMNTTKNPEKKLDVRLIAFDLDDTLLNSDCIVTEKTLEAIKLAAKKGIYIVLCSGRAENGILPIVRLLDIAGTEQGRFLIAFNGASIFDLHTRLPFFQNSVDSEILKFVYREAKKRGMASVVYEPDTIYSWLDTEWARMDAKLCNLNFKIAEDFESFLESKKFPKMLVPSEPEKVLELKNFLSDKLNGKADIFVSKPFFLEVMTHGVGKGSAILHLAEHLGIPKENTMAFGDSMNDESMIRECGYGVCMKNGLDYIKSISDFVTEKDNNNDGIGEFLEKYVL